MASGVSLTSPEIAQKTDFIELSQTVEYHAALRKDWTGKYQWKLTQNVTKASSSSCLNHDINQIIAEKGLSVAFGAWANTG